MFRTIRWYSGFASSLAFTYPKLRKVEKLYNEGQIDLARKMAFEYASDFAGNAIRLSGANVHVEGLELIPDGPVLFVGNHQSNFDIAVLLHYVPKQKGFIVKKELEKSGLLARWMRLIECIFIDRSSVRKSMESIKLGVQLLKSGYSIVVFPEGTRSKGPTMNEFKAGSLKMATKAGVPVVPFTINGTYKLMEANKNKIVPADVYLTIHPAIETANISREEEVELTGKVEAQIKSKLMN